jgi:hypothetical protein
MDVGTVFVLALGAAAALSGGAAGRDADTQGKRLTRSDVEAIRALERPSATGLYVFEILGGSHAAAAGLRIGDILTHYDGQPVATHADLSRLARIANDDKREEILLIVRRGDRELEFTVPRGPMGVRLEDVASGEERVLPSPDAAPPPVSLARREAFDRMVRSREVRWKLVYPDTSAVAPRGWRREFVAAASPEGCVLRIQQLLEQDGASLRQDVVLGFEPSGYYTPSSLRFTVNDKLILEVRREGEEFVGTRAGVPVRASRPPDAVSTYLAPYLAASLWEEGRAGAACSYLPAGSLEAAPWSEIRIDRSGSASRNGGAGFVLRKLGRWELSGEILPGGEIGEVRYAGGVRVAPATREEVLARHPDAESVFPPIERLPAGPAGEAPGAN